jgi:hypothetical protein
MFLLEYKTYTVNHCFGINDFIQASVNIILTKEGGLGDKGVKYTLP